MRRELDEALCAKYPEIFKDRRGDMQATAMCWGFPGDGWYKILDDLCAGIMAISTAAGVPPPVASQVKEKYGGLRFYDAGCPIVIWTEFDRLVGLAEELSYKTCELCGDPGKPRNGGWILTLCDKHYKEEVDAGLRLAAADMVDEP